MQSQMNGTLGNIVYGIWEFKCSSGAWNPLNATVLVPNNAPNAITLIYYLPSHIRLVLLH